MRLPQDPANLNVLSKTRAARLLSRCHAALQEQTLSVSVLEAALEVAKRGELLYSESMIVRTRALLGRAAAATSSGDSPHWSVPTGEQRLSEVMGRMAGDRGLLEKLLLHQGAKD